MKQFKANSAFIIFSKAKANLTGKCPNLGHTTIPCIIEG